MKLKITDIIIGERQRIDLGDLSDLESMSDPSINQILPIVVHKTLNGYELADGRRRLAKATALNWTEIECVEKENLSEVQKQQMELFADIGRKDRTWQEKCIAIAKVYRIMKLQKAADGEAWSMRQMGLFTGMSKTPVIYMITVAEALTREPRDNEVWGCVGYVEAIKVLSERQYKEAGSELETRNQAQIEAERAAAPPPPPQGRKLVWVEGPNGMMEPSYPDQEPVPCGVLFEDTTEAPRPQQPVLEPLPQPGLLSLRARAELYNKNYAHLRIPNTPMIYLQEVEREFIHSFWFLSGGNVSDFYGSYQIDYLKRIGCMFPDCVGKQEMVHLFSGSLPPSDDYTRVGMDPTGQYKSDLEIDAHKLSSYLPFKPALIMADPPYSKEDSEHYQNSMVNRAVVMEQAALALRPGGYIVWMDQALPVFSNDLVYLVGAIGYIRSTGNRFRMVSIFRRHEFNKVESDYE